MYLVNPHRKEEQGHTPGILCCSIPSIFSMCMHGPVRKGVLADIVQVDPHVHACAPVTIIRWLARPPTLEELDLSWRFEEGELFQPSGNSFQRADMIPRGRDSRVPPFRAHPWPPVPRVPGGAPSRVPPCSRVPGSPVAPRPWLPRGSPSSAVTSRPVHSPVAPRRATPSSPVPGFHVLARPAGFAVATRPGFPRRPHSQAPPWLYPYGAHPPCPLPGIPRRPPSRVLPRPSLPVSPVTSCPRLPRGPSARGLPRGPRPGLPRGPPSRGLTRRPPSQWFCKGKGFIQLVDTHPKEEKLHPLHIFNVHAWAGTKWGAGGHCAWCSARACRRAVNVRRGGCMACC